MSAADSSTPPITRSPLADKIAGGPLNLREITEQTLINVRGQAADTSWMQRMQNVLGVLLPTTPNSTATARATVFWLGPDEWIVRTNDGQRQELLSELQTTTNDAHATVVDVSDYYTVLRLSGAHACDALAVACPLDFHSDVFRTGNCAQSHYARAAVLLHRLDDAPTFDLQVRWSFADYVWEYLQAAE